eukprot:1146458-Pelagomonas_calceolata.AAC.1
MHALGQLLWDLHGSRKKGPKEEGGTFWQSLSNMALETTVLGVASNTTHLEALNLAVGAKADLGPLVTVVDRHIQSADLLAVCTGITASVFNLRVRKKCYLSKGANVST